MSSGNLDNKHKNFALPNCNVYYYKSIEIVGLYQCRAVVECTASNSAVVEFLDVRVTILSIFRG